MILEIVACLDSDLIVHHDPSSRIRLVQGRRATVHLHPKAPSYLIGPVQGIRQATKRPDFPLVAIEQHSSPNLGPLVGFGPTTLRVEAACSCPLSYRGKSFLALKFHIPVQPGFIIFPLVTNLADMQLEVETGVGSLGCIGLLEQLHARLLRSPPAL